jgi:hypothetical protein
MVLDDLEMDRDPIDAGSFGDIHRAKIQGHDIVVKVFKVFRVSDVQELFKVLCTSFWTSNRYLIISLS